MSSSSSPPALALTDAQDESPSTRPMTSNRPGYGSFSNGNNSANSSAGSRSREQLNPLPTTPIARKSQPPAGGDSNDLPPPLGAMSSSQEPSRLGLPPAASPDNRSASGSFQTVTETQVPELAPAPPEGGGYYMDELGDGGMEHSAEQSVDSDVGDYINRADDLPPPLDPEAAAAAQQEQQQKRDAAATGEVGANLGLTHEQLMELVPAPSSLFILGSTNPIRKICLKIARSAIFKNFILVMIVINSILLAMDQPAVENPKELDQFLAIMEIIFTVVFIIEMVLKVVALGFVLHDGSYLRSGWNILDFIIVVTSTIQLFDIGGNYSALRVFRVLRPLRSVSRVKKLKHLIAGLFRALPAVLDNMLLMLFILILFAIAAVQLWMGQLSQRCYVTQDVYNISGSNHSLPLLMPSEKGEPCGGTRSCPTLPNVTIECKAERSKFRVRNMNYENVITSFLLTLKIMVLDNWPDDLQDAMNFSGSTAALFFVILTLIGSFYCVNLFLAILTEGYSASSSKAMYLERKRQKEKLHDRSYVSRLKDNATQCDLDDPAEQALLDFRSQAFYDEVVDRAARAKEMANIDPSANMRRNSKRRSTQSANPLLPSGNADHSASQSGGIPPELMSLAVSTKTVESEITPDNDDGSVAGSPGAPLADAGFTQSMEVQENSPGGGSQRFTAQLSGKEIDGIPVEFFDLPPYTEVFTDDLEMAEEAAELRRMEQEAMNNPDGMEDGEDDDDDDARSEMSRMSSMFSQSDTMSVTSSVYYDTVEEEDERHWVRIKAGKLVSSRAVEYFMVVVTLINIIALSIDHYGIDEDLELALNIISFICLGFFTLEIGTKIFAFGWTKTMSRGFNQLDFVLVLVSIPDIALSGGGASGFSALRVFRLLRILRLMKEFESLQAVIQSVVHSVSSVAYLSLLILLFLYIFAIMGMQVFGNKYAEKAKTWDGFGARDSFGTLWQALLVAFIVVTGEDWTDRMLLAMHEGGRQEEFEAVIYFVLLYMIGNYILINLFVAIIIDKLQEKMEQINESAHLNPPLLELRSIMQVNALGVTRSLSGSQMDEKASSKNEGSPMRITPSMFGSGWNVKSNDGENARGDGDLPSLADDSNSSPSSATFSRVRSVQFAIDTEHKPKRSNSNSQDGAPSKNGGHTAVAVSDKSDNGNDKAASNSSEQAGNNTLMGIGSPANSRPCSPSTTSMSKTHVRKEDLDTGEEQASRETVNSIKLSERRFIDHIYDEELGCGPRLTRFSQWLFHVTKFPVEGKTLKLFSVDNPLRALSLSIVGSRAFNLFVDFLLFANVVFLCFESPKLSSTGQDVLTIADYVFTVVFVIEMLLKILAWSAIYPKGERNPKLVVEEGGIEWIVYPAYFRDPWNCCDAVVTVTAVLGLFVPIFGVFRSLRTIRLIARFDRMRIIVVALLQALPNILNGLLLGMFIFIVFGIMGVQFFKGEYYRCNDLDVLHLAECNGQYPVTSAGFFRESIVNATRDWSRETYHFDHLGASFLALFVVAVGDGWSQIMYNGMDTTHPEGGLKKDNQPYMAIYFILAFVALNFFAFNMIIGILINYFSKMKKLNDGSMLMSPDQRMYIKAQSAIEQAMFSDDLLPANNALSRGLDAMLTYRMSDSQGQKHRLPLSEFVIMFIVIVNVAFIAASHEGMDSEVESMIDTVSLVCLSLFTLEFVIKLVAYLPIQYFTQPWFVFDFAIVVVGWIDIVVPGVPGLSFLRVLRVSKLLKGSGVEKLLEKTIRSVSSFINVIAVLILTFFIFAVAGVKLFGEVKLTGALNQNNNFQTVPNAMLLLYQIVTTEGWSDVMTACMISEPECSKSEGNCGNDASATIYFVLFMILGAFTVLQLFVAVVVEIFTDPNEGLDEILELFMEMKLSWIERFGARKVVGYDEFIEFIPYVPKKLTELPKNYRRAHVIRLVSQMSLPIDSQFRVTYRDVVYSLAFKKYRIEVRTLAALLRESLYSLMSKSFTVAEVYCTVVIQRRFKEHLNQKHGVAPQRTPILLVYDPEEPFASRAAKQAGGDSTAAFGGNTLADDSSAFGSRQVSDMPPSDDATRPPSAEPSVDRPRGDSLTLPQLNRHETTSSNNTELGTTLTTAGSASAMSQEQGATSA